MITLTENGAVSTIGHLHTDPPLTAGIPQTFSNPMVTEFNRPWQEMQEDQAAAQRERRTKAINRLDSALLDPEAFFKANPFTPQFTDDAEKSKRRLIVSAALRIENGGKPLPMGTDGHELMRRRVAAQRFQGRGAEDDDAFHAELVTEATKRKDERAFFNGMLGAATDEAALPIEARKGMAGFLAAAKDRPGFDPAKSADYAETWQLASQEIADRIEPFKETLNTTWLSFKNKAFIPRDQLAQIPDENWPDFLAALRLRAETLPDKEKETFLAGMRKDLARSLEGFGRQAGEAFTTYATAPAATGFEPGDLQGPGVSDEVRAQTESARNRAAEVRRILDSQFDVIDYTKGWGWAQQIPGVTVTSLSMAVPVIGPSLMAASMQGAAQESLYLKFRDSGLKEADAGTYSAALAPAVMLPQVALEKLSFGIISNKAPGVSKALNALGDKIANRGLRLLTKTAAITAAEATIEVTQDFTQSVVQEIASTLQPAVPGVDLTKEFTGAWSKFPEIAGSMIVLSFFGAAGGMNREAQAAAWAQSTPLQRAALGITPEAEAALQSALAAGPSSITAAVDTAWKTRDATSPAALAAAQELQAQATSQATAQADLERLGYSMPRFVQSASGISVVDSVTGEELGQAPDLSGAVRIAKAHTVALDSMDADQVAALGTLMEASRAAAELDPKSVVDVAFTETFDPEKASPEQARRYAAQVALLEAAEGGTGDIARSVLGTSETTFAQGLRNTVNRIYRGGSVVTVFHETFHGLRRQARAAGTITRADEIAMLRALDQVFQGKKDKGGRALRFIPSGMQDADISETLLDEAFSEIGEMEVLRTRKGKGKSKLGLTRGIVSRNLSALARLIPGVAGKWTAFMRAVRAHWGLSLSRAVALKKAERDGEFDSNNYDAYLTKILGLDAQEEYDAGVRQELNRILSMPEDVADDDIPFSIGRSNERLDASGNPQGIDTNTPGGANIGDAAQPEMPRDAFGNPEPKASISGYGFNWGKNRGDAWFSIDSTTDWRGRFRAQVVGDSKEDVQKAFSDVLKMAEDDGYEVVSIGQSLDGTPSAKLLHKKAAEERNKLEVLRDKLINDLKNRVAKEGIPTFLRYGKPPESGKSWNGKDEYYEAGVSVYPASKIKGNTYVINLEGMDTISSMFIREQKIGDVFEVTGAEVVGKGADGEPLLKGGTYRKISKSAKIADLLTFNQSPPASSGAFSLGPADVPAIMEGNALARITDPRRRTQAMSRIARDFNSIRLQIDRLLALSGRKRSKSELRQEANAREDLRAEELIGAIHARYGSLLADDDLVKIKAQPVHAFLADPTSPLRGRLMSKAAAIKAHPEKYQLHRAGEYDGSDGISRSVFGGTRAPDQAAQELYDHGLIPDPTPDAMWEALMAEQNSVAAMKAALQKATEEIRAAKAEAKAEATEWLQTQGKDQETNFSPREEILRSLRMLDAILLAMPTEVRGKIGGYTQMARITTNEAKLSFLKDKLAKADKELEIFLRQEFAKEFEALMKKARPSKDNPGERPSGNIDPEAWEIFKIADAATNWKFAEAEAEATKYDTLADHEDTTGEDAEKFRAIAQVIRLVQNWTGADAARREMAVLELEKIYFGGLAQLRKTLSARNERLGKLRESARTGTGKTGHRMEREAAKLKGGKLAWEFMSFGQVVNVLFGEASTVARWMTGKEIAASNALEDAMQVKTNAMESMFETLAGSRFGGEKLRHRMQTAKSIKVTDALGIDQTFTESEAITFLLMWRQEDGARHMMGMTDESGAIISEWAWDANSAAEVERQLSPAGQQMLAFLGDSYGEEYGRINDVFRRIWNVSMPRHKLYAPLTVKATQARADTIMDPVSGDTMGIGMTPGSLKNRSQTAVAEPDFRDAFQVYLTHARQMEHFIAYGEFARDALAVINRRDTRNAIEAAGGKVSIDTLEKWVNYFALGGIRDANMGSEWQQWLGRALGRLSQAALVGRISVLAMQSMQLAAATYKMPLGAYLTRFAKLQTGRLDWSAALGSAYIQRRISEMPPVVRDAIRGLEAGTPNRLKYTAAKMARTIPGADALFTAGTYAIFYDYHLKQNGGNEAAAHAEAERLTDQVAQPTRPGARSMLELANAGNPAFRALWNFSSDPRQKVSLIVYEMMRRDTKGKAKAASAAKAIAITWGVSGVLQAVLRAVIRDLRDDEDEEVFDERHWRLDKLALQSLTGPLGALPFLGNMMEGVVYGVTGQRTREGSLLDALGQTGGIVPKWFIDHDFDAIEDAERIFTGGATLSGTSGAAASMMHAVRDAWNLIENMTSDE